MTGATAYDDPVTGVTYILLFHESLYYGTKLDHSLINPNQVRANEIPFWDNPYDRDHPLGTETPSLHLPLQVRGTKLYFTTRAPTNAELQNCERIHMTSQHEWDPVEVSLGECSRFDEAVDDYRMDIHRDEYHLSHVSQALICGDQTSASTGAHCRGAALTSQHKWSQSRKH